MEYPKGVVFCPVCHKRLLRDEDIERGYHFHCEKSEVFCEEDEIKKMKEI